ncbi:MAG: response regulator transcription factor [Acidobacteria bacterium]|nr:response regulator transcription factor [Acidobacteriota bacterium]
MPIDALLVDDDARLPEMLKTFLEPQGVALTLAPGGAEALVQLERQAFDVVILDVMMPGMDGLETLRRLRAKSNVPVIMLTARGDEADRIVGLELGADDYLPKPFSSRELLARIRALVRRAGPSPAEKLEYREIRLMADTREVWKAGEPVALTALEFDLLAALMRRRGRVVPREALLRLAGRADTTVNERAVDVHVAHLRQKLDDDPPRLIKTVRGVGYVFAAES